MSIPDSLTQSGQAALDTPEFQYAYYFPEGSGYLYVDRLGAGTDGAVDIVWSCAEAAREAALRHSQVSTGGNSTVRDMTPDADRDFVNKLFVRKKTIPLLPEDTDPNLDRYPIPLAEIRHFRRHPRVPELMDWTEYRPLSTTHPHHLHVTSVAMVFQYCNGGNLKRVLDEYLGLQKIYQSLGDAATAQNIFVPEPFVWRVFGQVLQVAHWLHNQRPGICHADIHTENVFLHFSEHEQVMPDCLLGDFGRSKIMSSRSWDSNGIPAVTGVDACMGEYEGLLLMIKELMTLVCAADVPGGTSATHDTFDGMSSSAWHYSALLYDQIRRFENKIEDCRADGSNPDFSDLAKHMIGMGDSMNGLRPTSLRNIHRQYGLEPKTFATAQDLLQEPEDSRPHGPWKVAKIRTGTKEVVALSRDVYRTYQPVSSVVVNTYAGDLRGDDSYSIPASDRDVSTEQL